MVRCFRLPLSPSLAGTVARLWVGAAIALAPRPASAADPTLSALTNTALTTATPSPVARTFTLDQALAEFRAESPTQQQLAARVALARAQVHLASAALKPVLAVQGGYTRNSDDAIISLSDLLNQLAAYLPANVQLDPSLFPPDFIIQPINQWTGGATLKVPIFEPVAWADLGAARKASAATQAGAEDATLQAEAGLIKAAWLASAAKEGVAATRHGVQAAQAQRDSEQQRLDAGIGTELELLQAGTELVRRQSDLVQAVAKLDQAHRALGALLGIRGPVAVTLPPLETELAKVHDVAPDQDLARHPRMLAAQAAVEAAQGQVNSAWWRHSPTLDGTATMYGSDVEYVTGKKDGWRLGLNLTWVLYDGGARYGLLDRARAQRAQAQATARQASLDLSRAEADAIAAVDVARQRLRLAENGLALATQAEATASRLYDAGLVSNMDLLDAQQRRTDADLAHAGGRAQVGVALTDLAVARGQRVSLGADKLGADKLGANKQ
ncbi:MAG: TolC family protein [Oligoflexia bacterium]|nr:TolC family protein [Oligoflexia bacterium]